MSFSAFKACAKVIKFNYNGQMISLSLKSLRMAQLVRDERSFSRAAERIPLTQSAVSQAVRKLETEIGYTLFESSPAGVVVTEAGARFLRRTDRAMAYLKEIDETLSRSAGMKVTLIHRTTTSQLKAFIEVYEQRSYSRAAQKLGLAQPSVHKAVRDFENLCQTRFYRRSPQGVEATWSAKQIAQKASLLFAELDQAIAEIREYYGIMDGKLRIGALPLARASLIPKATIDLLKQYPQARVSIVDGPYDEQLTQLLTGELDIIIGALRTPYPSPLVIQEELFEDHLYLVTGAHHPLANRSDYDPRTLQTLSWLAPKKGTPARAVFEGYFEAAGLEPPQKIIECSSLIAIRGILMGSEFAALLPAKQVSVDVLTGALAISPKAIEGTSRPIGLTYRKDWIPTALQTSFLRTLRSTVVEL